MYQATTIRAGIDWYSATYADSEKAWLWAMRGIHAINEIGEKGERLKPRSLNGYSGISAGGSFAGSREDGYFVQVSGKYADDYFDELYNNQVQVTRIDIQCTVQFDVMPDQLGKDAYNGSSSYCEYIPLARRWTCYEYAGSDGGYTCYIGSPSSPQRASIYNKEAQSEEPQYSRCWRFEVRFRGDLADRWAKLLSGTSMPRNQSIRMGIDQWLCDRGLCYRFLHGNDVLTLPKVKTRDTDVERKIKWLRSQVAPSILWLSERVSVVELLQALGLEGDGHSALIKPQRQLGGEEIEGETPLAHDGAS